MARRLQASRNHLPADLPQARRPDVPRPVHSRRRAVLRPSRIQAVAAAVARLQGDPPPLSRLRPVARLSLRICVRQARDRRDQRHDAAARMGRRERSGAGRPRRDHHPRRARLGRAAQAFPPLLTRWLVNEAVGASLYLVPASCGERGSSMATAGIEEVTENAIRAVARDCGSLSMECSDVAGYVQDVAGRIGDHLKMLDGLEEVTTRLLADQARVSDSTDEARLLSEQAKAKLEAGREAIEGTIGGFKGLTELVVQLGERMAGFAAAMNQVQMVSSTIETIARKTNMLALNATIEAARAGDAGRSFAVVAAEVKKLAHDTRAATSQIASTIVELTREASEIVGMVDRQTEGIAHSTSMIQTSVDRVKAGLTDFAGDARANGSELLTAEKRLAHLEMLSN